MNTTKQKLSDAKQERLVMKKLSDIIRDWTEKNKRVFWKYEVSSFYKSYKIRVANLPGPSTENILVSSNNRLLNHQQKTQLCNAIEKACVNAEVLGDSCIDVQIDYVNDAVIAEVIQTSSKLRLVQ
jgi:hypothetical protein